MLRMYRSVTDQDSHRPSERSMTLTVTTGTITLRSVNLRLANDLRHLRCLAQERG